MNQLHAQGVQALYPGTIPNYIDGPNLQKSEVTGGIERKSNVSIPTYEFFEAKGGKTQKPCVVVCPGGGYKILASTHEGTDSISTCCSLLQGASNCCCNNLCCITVSLILLGR